MKKIDVKFSCEKCGKEIETFYFSDIPESLDTQERKKEVIDYLKFLHDKNEHTHCQLCGERIKPGEGYDFLPTGWRWPKGERLTGEFGTSLFLLVCKKCSKKHLKKGGE